MAEMQNHFKIKDFTLDEWRQYWLEKASVNILEPSWNSEDKSANAKLTINMTPYTKEHPTLRPHKIKIGLFKADCSVDVIETLVKPQETNIVEYDGSKNYRGVLLNY